MDEVEKALADISKAIELKRKLANLTQNYAFSAEKLARIDLLSCIREAVEERFGINGWRLIWTLTEIKRLEKAGVPNPEKEKWES